MLTASFSAAEHAAMLIMHLPVCACMPLQVMLAVSCTNARDIHALSDMVAVSYQTSRGDTRQRKDSREHLHDIVGYGSCF